MLLKKLLEFVPEFGADAVEIGRFSLVGNGREANLNFVILFGILGDFGRFRLEALAKIKTQTATTPHLMVNGKNS